MNTSNPKRRAEAPAAALTARTAKPARREWLTVNQAAEYVGVHPKTIRKWYRAGRLPAYRTAGGPVRIDRADLDAVTQRLVPPAWGGVL